MAWLLPVIYDDLEPRQRREVRLQYVREQGGLCAYCQAPLSGMPRQDVAALRINTRLFPAGFFQWPVHLHHDRGTGETVGAVHAHCNAVLWQYEGK